MNRYLLTFYKKGNMRFISHLDLQRLFQRAVKRGDIDVAYSHGFNPHELMNIVQPLSLGFEGLKEFLELDTNIPYNTDELISRMNLSMPEGMGFTSCIELERKNQSTSCPTKAAEYEVKVFGDIPSENLISEFLSQEKVLILKRDKKTKTMVEKDVKSLIYSIDLIDKENKILFVRVACGSNSTVNPVNLLNSLYDFAGMTFNADESRITRTAIIREEE